MRYMTTSTELCRAKICCMFLIYRVHERYEIARDDAHRKRCNVLPLHEWEISFHHRVSAGSTDTTSSFPFSEWRRSFRPHCLVNVRKGFGRNRFIEPRVEMVGLSLRPCVHPAPSISNASKRRLLDTYGFEQKLII